MKSRILTGLLFVSSLAMLGCAVATHSSPIVPDPDLASFSNYRQWTKVNPTPQLMERLSAQMCAANVPGRQEGSPHLNKFVSVFVNSVGRVQMMTKRSPRFPVGSMIVKEKLGSPVSTEPELLTAMIKRQPGYNPESGDWEYLVLDGAASKIVERGKLTRCSGCHRPYQSTDFVTRTYLPQEVRRTLN